MKSYIVLIRHGTTEGIVNHWFYGWADLHVVQEGFDAIDRYKEEGAYPELPEDARFYVTPLIRTKETLHHLFGDVPYEEIEEMKEINFGDWECKTFDELKELPGAEEWINDGTGTFCFPGGESMNGYMERISRGKISPQARETISFTSDEAVLNKAFWVRVFAIWVPRFIEA